MERAKTPRMAILISGNGTNMEAIGRTCEKGSLNAEIALVASDNPDAPGLKKAESAGYETFISPYKKGLTREENEGPFIEIIREKEIDWIVLAGFMKILSSRFVASFPGRIVNIHPSLLPAFPGAHAIQDAFEANADVTGVTVHLVDELVDHGPVIAQEEVFVLPSDTPETLTERIHQVEHKLYPQALQELMNEDY